MNVIAALLVCFGLVLVDKYNRLDQLTDVILLIGCSVFLIGSLLGSKQNRKPYFFMLVDGLFNLFFVSVFYEVVESSGYGVAAYYDLTSSVIIGSFLLMFCSGEFRKKASICYFLMALSHYASHRLVVAGLPWALWYDAYYWTLICIYIYMVIESRKGLLYGLQLNYRASNDR